MPAPGSPSLPIGSRAKEPSPRHWLRAKIPRSQLYRLAPRPPKLERLGRRAAWHWLRRWIRNWVLWAVTAFLLAETGSTTAAIPVAFAAVVFYLASPRFHPAVYPVEPKYRPGEPEFIATMQGATGTPYVEGNDVRFCQNGDRFYPAMLEAIESAQTSVTMEQYIWWAGEVGRRFAVAFAEKARSGVPVKLLVDHIGSAAIGEETMRILEAAGAQLAWHHPIRWYTLDRANHRTHRKSVIVDGRIAFTGGAGIADHWLGDSQRPGDWRDMMIRIEGPAAVAQQTGFAQNWLMATGELLSGPAYFPRSRVAGSRSVQTILSSPTAGVGSAATMYMLALQWARRSVWIANSYFVPPPAVIDLVGRIVRRGVEVKVMVAGPYSDAWWARQNCVRLYGPLLEAGVEIYEYLPTMMHYKTMVVDGVWATTGTTNFDNRSFSLNEETNVCFDDRELVAQLEQAFEDDLRKCMRIDYQAWRKRGLWQRAQEAAASIIEDQV